MTIKIWRDIELLDIGCGNNKAQGAIGIDKQSLPCVDIVWDLIDFPWPIHGNSVDAAVCNHVVEHIPPVAINQEQRTWFPFLRFMDFTWFVLKLGGTLTISCPKGGSRGFYQDPTHCNALNEVTWEYFDPHAGDPPGFFYSIYRPRPWHIEGLTVDGVDNMTVILRKVLS